MGSLGRAKSRHNKREQRGPAEKLAGGDRGEETRPGQAPAQVAGGAPARPAAPRGARSPAAAPPARESLPARPPCPAGRRAFLPGSDRVAQPRVFRNHPCPLPRQIPVAPPSRGLSQTSAAGGAGPGASAAPARRGSAE